jgi:hypothetical protein
VRALQKLIFMSWYFYYITLLFPIAIIDMEEAICTELRNRTIDPIRVRHILNEWNDLTCSLNNILTYNFNAHEYSSLLELLLYRADSRESIRLMIEYGLDVQQNVSRTWFFGCFRDHVSKINSSTYPPMLDMLQDILDYLPVSIHKENDHDDTSFCYWTANPLKGAIVYLQYHGSLNGFAWNLYGYCSMQFSTLDLDRLYVIFNNDLLSDKQRRALYTVAC